MHLIFRSRSTSVRSILPGIISARPTTAAHLPRIRRSYGSEHKPPKGFVPASKRSRELEHPGPPPPNTSEVSQNTGAPVETTPDGRAYADLERRPQKKEPSNKARPTLNDGRESPNVDLEGNLREDVPEDVKRHNRELQQRYDRAYNQIVDGGRVSKGFWKGGGGSLTEDQGGARRDGGH